MTVVYFDRSIRSIPDSMFFPCPEIFFDLNSNNYEITTDVHRRDIDIALNNYSVVNGKINATLNIFHNFNNQIQLIIDDLMPLYPKDLYFVTNAIDKSNPHKNILHVDFLFNRTKAYYSQFPFSSKVYKWYHVGNHGYILPNSMPGPERQKIFLAPNKTHKQTRPYRQKLLALLARPEFQPLGFASNPDDTPGSSLIPQIDFLGQDTLTSLDMAAHKDSTNYYQGHYSPPHNHYYKHTFISIYTETLEVGTSIAPTEKTYDPLIKYHFILPFSTCGFIKHLKGMGFLFPEFIDYSYDNIVDDNARFESYLNEAVRLLQLPKYEWPTQLHLNKDLLEYNCRLFWHKDYDRINFHTVIKNHIGP